jgi:hypothetical protein
VLDRAGSPGDTAAVADGDDRFVAQPEGDETLSMAFLSTPGTLWLYSGVTTR